MPLTNKNEKYFFFGNDKAKGQISGYRHYHDTFEIYYLESGHCRYFIDSKCYDVDAGDIVLIPEGVIHHTTYRDEYHSRKLINCSNSYIPSSVADRMPSMLYLYRNTSISTDIKQIFQNIEEEYYLSDAYSKEAVAAHVRLLFYLLARNENQYPSASTVSEYVSSALEMLLRDFTENITLSGVAERISISPEHLSRIFKKETGFGFSEYLTILRLKKAEEMLKSDTRTSIAEVAYACGFNDSNYFSERFKANYGSSPKDYKKELFKA